MSNPTTPFSWQMPTATDLVTDLPADFEVFGQAVATSMADLLGGTSGQVLAKNSNTDMDFVWVTSDDANAIQNTIVDAKGDLIAASASDVPARLAVGTNGQILVADSTASTGLKWANQGYQFIKRASFSNVATTTTTFDSIFSTTYESYLVVIEEIYSVTQTDDLQMQFRTGSTTHATAYYGNYFGAAYNATSGTFDPINAATQATLAASIGIAAYPFTGSFLITRVANGSRRPNYIGSGVQGGGNLGPITFGGMTDTAGTYDGLIFKSSSGNVTGTIAIYGLAKS
jgi:hypothetical protein